MNNCLEISVRFLPLLSDDMANCFSTKQGNERRIESHRDHNYQQQQTSVL